MTCKIRPDKYPRSQHREEDELGEVPDLELVCGHIYKRG